MSNSRWRHRKSQKIAKVSKINAPGLLTFLQLSNWDFSVWNKLWSDRLNHCHAANVPQIYFSVLCSERLKILLGISVCLCPVMYCCICNKLILARLKYRSRCWSLICHWLCWLDEPEVANAAEHEEVESAADVLQFRPGSLCSVCSICEVQF